MKPSLRFAMVALLAISLFAFGTLRSYSSPVGGQNKSKPVTVIPTLFHPSVQALQSALGMSVTRVVRVYGPRQPVLPVVEMKGRTGCAYISLWRGHVIDQAYILPLTYSGQGINLNPTCPRQFQPVKALLKAQGFRLAGRKHSNFNDFPPSYLFEKKYGWQSIVVEIEDNRSY